MRRWCGGGAAAPYKGLEDPPGGAAVGRVLTVVDKSDTAYSPPPPSSLCSFLLIMRPRTGAAVQLLLLLGVGGLLPGHAQPLSPGAGWTLVAQEGAGATGTDALRNLELRGAAARALRVRVEWGIPAPGTGPAASSIEFDVPAGSEIFGDFVDPRIPIQHVVASGTPINFSGGAVFCKMCSKSNKVKPGDSCWGVLPASDKHRACGCNGGGWAGQGVYYGGNPKCNSCGCRTPNAFTGSAKPGQAKGGVGSVGLRIWVLTQREWALESVGARITETSSTIATESPGCAANVHNLLAERPLHTCAGECKAGTPCRGDARFMFGRGDMNQRIVINLGQPCFVDKIGAEVSTGDREVWEHFKVDVSQDGQNWYRFGEIGRHDRKPDIHHPHLWVSIDVPVQIQRVRFHFGRQSKDYGGVGSAIQRLHVQLVGLQPVVHPWPAPLVQVDVDERGQVRFGGLALRQTHNSTGVLGSVKGVPQVVKGPDGKQDALLFARGKALLLGSTGVDTDATWTVDCYIQMPMFKSANWGTLTRGKLGDHQVIVQAGSNLLGSFDNSQSRAAVGPHPGFISSGYDLGRLLPGWYRLTVSSRCQDATCKAHRTSYYVDGKEVGYDNPIVLLRAVYHNLVISTVQAQRLQIGNGLLRDRQLPEPGPALPVGHLSLSHLRRRLLTGRSAWPQRPRPLLPQPQETAVHFLHAVQRATAAGRHRDSQGLYQQLL